jgi:hypothetical protein
MSFIKDSYNKNKSEFSLAIVLFLGFSIGFLYINQFPVESNLSMRQTFGGFYTLMALVGGIIGIATSRKWGGYKSLMGRAILFLSLGLFLQTFGQISNSIYNVFLKVEIPYPSLGDIGFFGSVIAYLYGAFCLLKTSGSKFSFRLVQNKIWAVIIPLVILLSSYYLFLKGYEFDWTNKLKIFLDFGYPFGQATYISIALLAFMTSRKILGGLMRKPILFFLLALAFDYLADFIFLYQVSHGTWVTGGINDYEYFVSYFVMTLAIIYVSATFKQIRES